MAKRSGIIFLVGATAFLALAAYWLLFSAFMAYDDEGYVLISLKNYSLHGGLYSSVFSQYGPFFYALNDAGHRLLGYEFTNTNGRLITLLCWILATAACGNLVWRVTRAVTFTFFALGLTFFHLWLLVSEPIHPGGLIVALVAGGTWLGARLISRHAWRALAVATGLIGGALLLTKINVGLFYLTSGAAWFVIQLRPAGHARWTSLAVAVALVVLPLALMRAELGEEWGQIFAGISVVVSLTVLSIGWRERRDLTSWGDGGRGTGALILLSAVTIGLVCLRGTSVSEMLEGVLFGPLRHPGIYHYPPFWRPGTSLVGLASLLLAMAVWCGQLARVRWLIVGLRVGLAIAIGLASSEWLPYTSHGIVISYVMPLAWIFVLRLEPAKTTDPIPVAPWIGLILALQFLHAYPVAGSQIGWGTFLIMPLVAIGLWDTQKWLKETCRQPVLASGLGVVCFAVAGISAIRLGDLGRHRYAESQPLALSGAEDVRPPNSFGSTMRILVLNARAHGDMLFSMPGMFSFNQWSGLPTPTLNNTTHWFSLLSNRQQQDIIHALASSRRPVMIFHRKLIDFLNDSKFIQASPLYDYLRQDFERSFTLEGYEFWVRRGYAVAPLGRAEFLQLQAPTAGLAEKKLELVVALPSGSRIARIELATLDGKPRTTEHWDKTTGPLYHTPINLKGAAFSPEIKSSWDEPLTGLVRLDLPLDHLGAFERKTDVIYVLDAEGSRLAEARFMD